MAQLQQPLLRLLAVTSGATDDDVALQGARTELDGVGVTEGWVAKLQPRKSEEIMKFITLWNRNLEDPLIKMIISYNDCCTIDLIYVLLFMF